MVLLNYKSDWYNAVCAYWLSISCTRFLILACGRPRWFLIIGIILIIVPGPIYITIVQYSSTSRYSEIHGCYIQYKSYLPYARIALDLPSNIIFSAIFLMVIYRHYKRYQEACWKKLAKDGVITMLLVVASNMLCFIINATEVIKENGDLLYIVDW
ncbi:hypothetical protein BDF19DRAFT_433223 [Syncephalis fuscata]|nr:hypothetical protein BDF19DRAFT_433223 [Syncephalis fuscata]